MRLGIRRLDRAVELERDDGIREGGLAVEQTGDLGKLARIVRQIAGVQPQSVRTEAGERRAREVALRLDLAASVTQGGQGIALMPIYQSQPTGYYQQQETVDYLCSIIVSTNSQNIIKEVTVAGCD